MNDNKCPFCTADVTPATAVRYDTSTANRRPRYRYFCNAHCYERFVMKKVRRVATKDLSSVEER